MTGAVILAGCSSPAPAPPKADSTAVPGQQPVAAAAPEPSASTDEIARLRQPVGGDIDAIRARGYLRLLVVPSRTGYAIEQGLQRGSSFNAGKAFEAFLKATLGGGENRIRVVFVPVHHNALVTDLNAGHGDIAASLLVTFERDDQVLFSEPVRKGVRELIVTGPGVPPIVSLEDVAGRDIHVRQSSDHYASLVRLNQQLAKAGKPGCRIAVASETLMDEDLVQLVNAGKIPATLVDDYVFKLMKATVPKVAVNEDVAVSQDGVLAWAMRKDSPKLRALVNEFIVSHHLAREGGR